MPVAGRECASLLHVPAFGRRLLRSAFSLRVVLTAYVVIPVVAVLTVSWYVAVRNFETESEERMQEEVELIARAIRLPLSRALDRGSEEVVQQSLDSAFRIGRVYGAYVYDAGGEVMAAAGNVTPDPETGRVRDIVSGGRRTGEYGEVGGRRIYSYFVPLTGPGGRISAVLEVTRRRSDFEGRLAGLRRQAVTALVALALAAAGVVLWGHHHGLGKHINRLSADMAQVERGDRSHRSELTGPREIATLAASLNSMLDGIGRSEDEIEARRRVQASLEEELRRTEKLAAVGRLAAGVAHEMGTPLSVVDGLAQRALRDTSLPEHVRKALRATRQQVQRLERTVRQLMEFGRSREPQMTRIRAAGMASRAANLVREEAAASATELNLDGPGDLEAGLDAARFEQALVNLLRNAVQASPGGRVLLSWELRDGRLVFRVEDDGPGVAEEVRNRIFEPFFTTKGVGKGTGLGLAVAHGVMEDLGGSVRITESCLGGAGFEVSLPVNAPGEVNA